jgi:hypothetical protein
MNTVFLKSRINRTIFATLITHILIIIALLLGGLHSRAAVTNYSIIGGTYPISYDPSYWYEGVTTRYRAILTTKPKSFKPSRIWEHQPS